MALNGYCVKPATDDPIAHRTICLREYYLKRKIVVFDLKIVYDSAGLDH